MSSEPEAAPGGCSIPGTPSEGCRVHPLLWSRLLEHFGARRAGYVVRVLTPGELAVISDPADALAIARIKRMPAARLEQFDRLAPADGPAWRLYRSLQLRWLRDEEYLLGTRLGRSPNPTEMSHDFDGHQNGLRFRAYFALKHPEKMMLRRCAGGPPAFAARFG